MSIIPAIPDMVSIDLNPSNATLDTRPLLTVIDVAERLSVSPAWVRDHAARKEPRLRAMKMGALLRFHPDHIDQFIRNQADLAARRARCVEENTSA